MSNDKKRDDHVPPMVNSLFLGIHTVETGKNAKGVSWYRYKAHWVVDMESQEKPGTFYASAIAVEGWLNEAVWQKLKPFRETLLEERDNKKTRVLIRAVESFLKPPRAYVVDSTTSNKAVPVMSFTVYRISHAKRPGENWTIYEDEQQKSAMKREISNELSRRAETDDTTGVGTARSAGSDALNGVDAFGMI